MIEKAGTAKRRYNALIVPRDSCILLIAWEEINPIQANQSKLAFPLGVLSVRTSCKETFPKATLSAEKKKEKSTFCSEISQHFEIKNSFCLKKRTCTVHQ